MRRHQLVGIALLLFGCPYTLRQTHAKDVGQEREAALLQQMWAYQPELPRSVLTQAVGLQGDRGRLERFFGKLIRGEPVKVALLGGSLSLRGWNYPDESYLRQVHKWLELTFVEGCRKEAESRAKVEAATPSPPQWKGKRHPWQLEASPSPSRQLADEPEEELGAERQLASDGQDGGQASKAGMASGMQGRAPASRARKLAAAAAAAGRPVAPDSELSATVPSEGEWIPERGPASPTELHSIPSAGYRSKGNMCSGSKIQLVNLAVPAAGPGYAERCVIQRLPEDCDLVIMDFGINDFQKADALNHPERQAFERMMRKALSLPKSPAVILFEAYSPYQAKNTYIGGGVGVSGRESGNLSQDKHMLIAEYYGEVQVISVRAAVWQLIMAAEDPANLLIYLGKHFLKDMIHVTPFGHRWYADLMISYMRDVVTDLLTRSMAARALGKQLPDAVKQSWALTQEAPESERLCWGGTLDSAAGNCSVAGNMGRNYKVLMSPSGLKKPFFRDNEFEESGVCALGEEFQDLVTDHDGWQWKDDGKPGKPKWGYACETVGKKLVLSVDVSGHKLGMQKKDEGEPDGEGAGEARIRNKEVIAFLIYLSSWRDMGHAKVTCSEGCSCTPTTIDAFAKDQRFRASVPMLHEFKLLPKEGSTDKCLLTVELLKTTSTEGHLFKVMGLTTTTHQLFHLDFIVRRGEDQTSGRGDNN